MVTWNAFERQRGKFGQGEEGVLVFGCAQNHLNHEGLIISIKLINHEEIFLISLIFYLWLFDRGVDQWRHDIYSISLHLVSSFKNPLTKFKRLEVGVGERETNLLRYIWSMPNNSHSLIQLYVLNLVSEIPSNILVQLVHYRIRPKNPNTRSSMRPLVG